MRNLIVRCNDNNGLEVFNNQTLKVVATFKDSEYMKAVEYADNNGVVILEVIQEYNHTSGIYTNNGVLFVVVAHEDYIEIFEDFYLTEVIRINN